MPVLVPLAPAGRRADLLESEPGRDFLRHNHGEYADRFADLFEVLLGTGMRRGEVLGLHWADVHLAEKVLLVRWNLTAIDDNLLYLGHLCREDGSPLRPQLVLTELRQHLLPHAAREAVTALGEANKKADLAADRGGDAAAA